MLTYDLQRYHPAFSFGVVDQVMEDIRRGMESNLYSMNQRRIASIKFLGELYIYRLISSGIIFDTLWTLVTFGHRRSSSVLRMMNVFIDWSVAAEGRPLPGQPCPLDMPDDFFRVRLVCVLLDTCGMCFDRGSQQKKLDNFLAFFQLYVHCKNSVPMDVEFMLNDSLEAVRPKLVQFKSFEEAAVAVDEMFNVVFQNAGGESGFKIEAGSPTEEAIQSLQAILAMPMAIAVTRAEATTMTRRKNGGGRTRKRRLSCNLTPRCAYTWVRLHILNV